MHQRPCFFKINSPKRMTAETSVAHFEKIIGKARIERNLSVPVMPNSLKITAKTLKNIVNFTKSEHKLIDDFLHKEEVVSNNPLSFYSLYHFIKLILHICNYDKKSFLEHPVLTLLFENTYLLEAFITLRMFFFIDINNFPALYLLSINERKNLYHIVNHDHAEQKVGPSLLAVFKKITPPVKKDLHALYNILGQTSFCLVKDIFAILLLNNYEIRDLLKNLTNLLNKNKFSQVTYRAEITKKFNDIMFKILNQKTCNMELALYFINAGVNAGSTDNYGNNILHQFTNNLIKKYDVDLCMSGIKELINVYKLDLNKTNNFGVSPWHNLLHKSDSSHLEYIYSFLQLGADFSAINTLHSLDLFIMQSRWDEWAKKILNFLSVNYNDLHTSLCIDPSWKINPEHLHLKKLLGEGNFGKVFLATYQEQKVAVKKMKLDKYTMFTSEVAFLYDLSLWNVSYVTQFMGYFVNLLEKNCLIFMEYLEHGALRELYETEPRWNNDICIKIIENIVQAVHSIHQMGYLHCDIKSDNILINNKKQAKLADFGLVCKINNNKDCNGTQLYMAPEMLRGQPNSLKTEVFSLAFTMLEIISWKFIWDLMGLPDEASTACFSLDIKRGIRPTIPNNCPPKLAHLISLGWQHNAEARPSIIELEETLKTVYI